MLQALAALAIVNAPLTRLSLAQRSASVVSPLTPLVLREFYLFDALKSLPEEAESLAAYLLDTQPASVRELRAQLLIDLPAGVSALSRRMRESSAARPPPASAVAAVTVPSAPTGVGEQIGVVTAAAGPPAAPSSSVRLPGGMALTLPELPLLSELPPLPDFARVSSDLAALQRSLLASPPPDVSAIVDELQNLWREEPLNLEQPAYTVLKPLGALAPEVGVDYEIRRYAAYAVARTELPGAAARAADGAAVGTEAMGAGFDKLARYIFGGNEANRSMAMTMPVETVAPSAAGANGSMAFYLGPAGPVGAPAAFPEPADGDVRVATVPARTVAVMRFAGFATPGAVERARAALSAQLARDDVRARAREPPSVLQYNPPYTLPHRRRNELAIAVDYASPALVARGEAGAMHILDELYDV